MAHQKDPNNRRRFLRTALVATIAPTVITDHFVRTAHADELVKLTEDDPQAQALGYKHDTEDVDASKFSQHNKEQNCANCQLIQGEDGEEWRPCPIFLGKSVNAKGWCSAWVKKA